MPTMVDKNSQEPVTTGAGVDGVGIGIAVVGSVDGVSGQSSGQSQGPALDQSKNRIDSAIGHVQGTAQPTASGPAPVTASAEADGPTSAGLRNRYSTNQHSAPSTPVTPALDGQDFQGHRGQGSTPQVGRRKKAIDHRVTPTAQNPARPNRQVMSSDQASWGEIQAMAAKASLDIKKGAFLISYAMRGTVVGAARDLGFTPKEVWGWADQDPQFANDLAIAHKEYVSHLEDVLDQRIKAGGKDAAILLMFKLKKENTQYRDKVDVKHSGGIGVAVTEMTTEELQKIVQQGRAIEGTGHVLS